ncbi:hypothetical protein RM553_14055 [Zunongwangia sp. F363]|uniref:Uncharacterized protein n=1 Tax=Autumnicola tepida TaxID=3075595 RepID=A0ABU3CC96_9FLAO|nr:hypothetical protein [Zunongwangia sp. F363]MDT0643957.1 hypothetical protein [Zunongwangia sp. F363]
MKNKHIHSALFLFLFLWIGISSRAQETLNAFDPNTFILGGGQESTTAVVDLQRIAITDLEPDPATGFSDSTLGMEAGNPFTGTGSPTTGEFWLNFTYRSLNFQNARIFVRVNQPIPSDMTIKVQIINTANINGVYNANPNSNPINLSTSEQIIVYDFASGYTGDGEGTGYLIEYNIINPSALSLPPGFEIIFEIK